MDPFDCVAASGKYTGTELQHHILTNKDKKLPTFQLESCSIQISDLPTCRQTDQSTS